MEKRQPKVENRSGQQPSQPTRREVTVGEAAQHVMDNGGRYPKFMVRENGKYRPVSDEEYHNNVF